MSECPWHFGNKRKQAPEASPICAQTPFFLFSFCMGLALQLQLEWLLSRPRRRLGVHSCQVTSVLIIFSNFLFPLSSKFADPVGWSGTKNKKWLDFEGDLRGNRPVFIASTCWLRDMETAEAYRPSTGRALGSLISLNRQCQC